MSRIFERVGLAIKTRQCPLCNSLYQWVGSMVDETDTMNSALAEDAPVQPLSQFQSIRTVHTIIPGRGGLQIGNTSLPCEAQKRKGSKENASA